ncbi:MAG: hypothetical protein JWO00_195 [Candidatus Parcubacteria bacterium]|nr:hypothetical protein [Candidatus Parcubacteria bacterium]
MKAKNYWILGVVIVIVIIICVIWSGSKSTVPASEQPAQTGTQSSQQAVGETPSTANAPLGTYPIHIKSNGPSIYYTPVNSATGTTGMSIQVNNPPANTSIISPLSVTGKAKGPWYFEASFPIILTDVNGKILAKTNAGALTDWMTTDFVSFAGKLSFARQATGSKGVLILKKDNPSGLAANDASIEIQVTFK